MKGRIFVVSGPSGVGKGTIVKKLIDENREIGLSISATTRKMRPGEKEGISYYYKTEEEFKKMVAEGEFLEWASFCENSYGTPKTPIYEKINKGTDVILEIEVQGAMQVKKNHPECILIFVVPPSKKVLKERLMGRGTETDDVIELRTKRALEEFKLAKNYDYVVVNDTVSNAVRDILNIINSERLKTSRVMEDMEDLL